MTVTAVKPKAAEKGEEPGLVRFTLDQPADREMQIGYRLGGTATAGDYSLPEPRAVIAAGKTAADLTIKPIDDTLVEADETCIVTLVPGAAYAGDGTNGEAVIMIADDDNTLVDDSLEIYYTFDGADLTKETATIRDEMGPAHPLSIQSYMATMPALAPGPERHGDAITFPKGRERVTCAGTLTLADYTVAFRFKSPEKTTGICGCTGGPQFFLKDGVLGVNNGGWPSRPARIWPTAGGTTRPSRGTAKNVSSSSSWMAHSSPRIRGPKGAALPAAARWVVPTPAAASSAAASTSGAFTAAARPPTRSRLSPGEGQRRGFRL